MRPTLLLLAMLMARDGWSQTAAKPEVSLDLQVDHERGRVRFTLRNRTDHELRLPEPDVQCRGKYGAWVIKTDTPLPPCSRFAGESYTNPKRWIVLWPDGYLDRWVSASRLHLVPGARSIRGEYVPPALSPTLVHTLRDEGIHTPQQVVQSAPVSAAIF